MTMSENRSEPTKSVWFAWLFSTTTHGSYAGWRVSARRSIVPAKNSSPLKVARLFLTWTKPGNESISTPAAVPWEHGPSWWPAVGPRLHVPEQVVILQRLPNGLSGTVSFDVTEDVRAIAEGQVPNYGWTTRLRVRQDHLAGVGRP